MKVLRPKKPAWNRAKFCIEAAGRILMLLQASEAPMLRNNPDPLKSVKIGSDKCPVKQNNVISILENHISNMFNENDLTHANFVSF